LSIRRWIARVCGSRHEPIENIELADQMALADTADRRIARHLADVLEAKSDEADARAAPRRRSRGFAAGMPSSNDQNVVHGRPCNGRRRNCQCFT
jgi:hypothetical protein